MTINKLPVHVVHFAAGDTSLFDHYIDYVNHLRFNSGDRSKEYSFAKEFEGKPLSIEEKERTINAMMLREVEKRAGFSLSSDVPLEQMMSNPTFCWALGTVSSMMIDAVLPMTIIEDTSAYAEIKVVGYGETGVFDIKSRDLFYVTRAGKGQRHAQLQKGFDNQATLYPENRMITVGVNLFRVLAGQESLAEFTTKAMRSLETEMAADIYTAFYNAMAGLDTTASTGLQVSGYTQEDMMILADKVSAFSGGAKPIAIGTKVALSKVLPDDTNTRADYTSEYVKLGYLRTVGGLDLFELKQVADWKNPFATRISNDYVWIVAPGTDKLIKCVIGGATITTVDSNFQNATLLQEATMQKAWTTGVITSSVAATIAL